MFRATDTFWAPDNRRIEKGDLVAPDDPVITGREALFQEVEILRAAPKAAEPSEQEPTADSGTAATAPAAPPAKKTAAKTTAAAAKTEGSTAP